jgi:outer membrane protein TolC
MRFPAAIWIPCALIAAACHVGPNFTRPDAPAATSYTAAPTPEESPSAPGTLQHVALGRDIEGDWWALFGSETIDALVREALAHNRTLAASAATLERARALAAAEAGSKYPEIDMTAGIGRQKYGEEFLGGLAPPLSFGYYAIGPTVSYTLDTSGGIARSIEGKFAEAEVAKHQLDAAYLTVTGRAVLETLAIASTRTQIATL